MCVFPHILRKSKGFKQNSKELSAWLRNPCLKINYPLLPRISDVGTLPETYIAPENGWLEYDHFLLGWPIFRGKLLALGSVSS